MDKRLVKRHKRQVARARQHVKVSEPDLRTPEQVCAAREVSRSVSGRRDAPREPYAAPSIRYPSSPAADGAARAEAEAKP
jgi:hypothetical protein